MPTKKDLVNQAKRDRVQKKEERRRARQDGKPQDAARGSGPDLPASKTDEPVLGSNIPILAQSADLLVAQEKDLLGLSIDEYYRRLFDRKNRGPGWWDEVLVFGKGDLDSVKVDDVIYIDPNDAIRDEKQPRKFFDQNLLWQLSHSIAICQQQETAQAYRNPNGEDKDHPWVVLNGERRWRATQQANLPYRIQVVECPTTEISRLIAQVTSNENRVGLSDLEIAWNIRDLRHHGMSIAQIMLLYGKSDAWVYMHLSILDLVPEVQELISPEKPEEKRLSLSTAIRLKDLPPEQQLETAGQIIGKSGFEAREIIRGVAEQNHTVSPSQRRRRGSDDLDIFRNILKNYLDRLAFVATYPDDRFGKMFLNLPP